MSICRGERVRVATGLFLGAGSRVAEKELTVYHVTEMGIHCFLQIPNKGPPFYPVCRVVCVWMLRLTGKMLTTLTPSELLVYLTSGRLLYADRENV